MDRRDLLTYHQAFIDLIDRPRVFDLILDLMGPYIQFSMSQAIVRRNCRVVPGARRWCSSARCCFGDRCSAM